MKLISYNQTEPMLKKHFRNLEHGTAKLTTYKRDRFFNITKQKGHFTIEEHGYKHETFHNLDDKDLFKVLKKRMRIEFPRSHKLYIKL